MLKNISQSFVLLALLLCASAAGAVAQGEQGGAWMRYGQKAIDGYKAKNYPAFPENAERAARAGPARALAHVPHGAR